MIYQIKQISLAHDEQFNGVGYKKFCASRLYIGSSYHATSCRFMVVPAWMLGGCWLLVEM